MAEAKDRAEWNQTALVAAVVNNTWNPTKRSPDDYNPYRTKARAPEPIIKLDKKETMALFGRLFG